MARHVFLDRMSAILLSQLQRNLQRENRAILSPLRHEIRRRFLKLRMTYSQSHRQCNGQPVERAFQWAQASFRRWRACYNLNQGSNRRDPNAEKGDIVFACSVVPFETLHVPLAGRKSIEYALCNQHLHPIRFVHDPLGHGYPIAGNISLAIDIQNDVVDVFIYTDLGFRIVAFRPEWRCCSNGCWQRVWWPSASERSWTNANLLTRLPCRHRLEEKLPRRPLRLCL